MTTIKILNKKGEVMEHQVMEPVHEVWKYLNSWGDVNTMEEKHNSRDFILLTKITREPIILQKRFIYCIE